MFLDRISRIYRSQLPARRLALLPENDIRPVRGIIDAFGFGQGPEYLPILLGTLDGEI